MNRPIPLMRLSILLTALLFMNPPSLFALLQQETVRQISSELDLDPGDTEAHFRRGYAYFQRGEDPEALRDFNQVISQNPQDPQAHYLRAQVQQRLGRPGYAIDDLSRAIFLQPSYGNAFLLRARYALEMNQVQKAIVDFTEVLKMQPEHVGALLGLGRAFSADGRESEARETFARAIRTYPLHDEAHRYLSWSYMIGEPPSLRNPEQALIHAEAACRIRSTSENLDTLAAAHGENRNFEKAISLIRELPSEATGADTAARLAFFEQKMSWSEARDRERAEREAKRAEEKAEREERARIWETIVSRNREFFG